MALATAPKGIFKRGKNLLGCLKAGGAYKGDGTFAIKQTLGTWVPRLIV